MRKNIVLSIAFGLAFIGCLGRELPMVNHYELQIQNDKQDCKKEKTIFWQGIFAQDKINTRKITYKESANRLEYFVKNQWIESLPTMLDSMILKSAENYCVKLTTNSHKSVNALALNVQDLYYDTQKNKAVFNAYANIELKNVKSFWIQEEVAVKDGDFSEIIKAMDKAVNQGIQELFTKINK